MSTYLSLRSCCCRPGSADERLGTEIMGPADQFADTMDEVFLPAGPRDSCVRTYAVREDDPMRGRPICTGTLLYLRYGKSAVDVLMSVHTNGFSLMPVKPKSPKSETGTGTPDSSVQGTDGDLDFSMAWSPFSRLERCPRRSRTHGPDWSLFRLTVVKHAEGEVRHDFATTGESSVEERDQWLSLIWNTISALTMSLFPPHAIIVRPLPNIESTSTRIMAGYLLLCEAANGVSLLYCELRSFSHGESSFAIYRDECCEHEVVALQLKETTIICTCNGLYCNMFGIGVVRFCARTSEEKELWIRAVMNVKTKIMFDAPDPTSDELAAFRESVRERLGGIPDANKDASLESASGPGVGAMLPLKPRPPIPCSPQGDVWHPEPLEDAFDPPIMQLVKKNQDQAQNPRKPTEQPTGMCQVQALTGVAVSSSIPVADEHHGTGFRPVYKTTAPAFPVRS